MRKSRSVATGLGLTSGLVVACWIFWTPSPFDLTGVQNARLYDHSVSADQFVAEIEIGEIAGIMDRAVWKSTIPLWRPLWKGAWVLDIPERATIRISYYGSFFAVEDKRGYYVVRPEDRAAFEAFCKHISQDLVIPWRLKRNAESKAESGSRG